MSDMKTIQSCGLFPDSTGRAVALRRQTNYMTPVGGPWPELRAGDKIIVEDTQGWVWQALVETIDFSKGPEDPRAVVIITTEKAPSPSPTVSSGTDGNLFIRLPNISGHAHARSWATGDVVQIGTAYYKVGRTTEVGSKIEYALKPATATQYATRPARVVMPSAVSAQQALGSAIQTKDGNWLHVKKIRTSRFGSAIGGGTTYWATGNLVDPAKASKLNEVHPEHLRAELHRRAGTRVEIPMPKDSTVLVPTQPNSFSASGERVAICDNKVLHERCGDPDQLDSWYHYVVEIQDKDMVARVKRFIKSKGL